MTRKDEAAINQPCHEPRVVVSIETVWGGTDLEFSLAELAVFNRDPDAYAGKKPRHDQGGVPGVDPERRRSSPRDLDAEVSITVDESKAEVAETEDEDDLGARLRKQFEDGLITEEEMNKGLQAD